MKFQSVNGHILPPEDTENCPRVNTSRCPFMGGDHRINTTRTLNSLYTLFILCVNILSWSRRVKILLILFHWSPSLVPIFSIHSNNKVGKSNSQLQNLAIQHTCKLQLMVQNDADNDGVVICRMY